MRTGMKLRILMGISSVCIIAIAMWFSYHETNHEEIVMGNIRLTEEISGVQIDFRPWEATREKTYYLILPAAFQKEEGRFEIQYDDFFYHIYIDGERYENHKIWENDLKEQIHTIQIKDIFGKIHMDKKIQVLISGELPTMMVTVEAKDELYDNTEYNNKNYIEKGEMIFYDVNGKIVLDTSLERFKVRGNSTAVLDKKPFTFTLPEPAALCGMEAAVNWNLLANMKDGSNIRNKMMLDWAGEVSDSYEAEGEFVELFLNGEYQGLYLLTETIEMGAERIEYEEEGLLIEMDLDYYVKEGQPSVQTKEGHTFIIHSDEYMLDDEVEAINTYLNEIESALYSEDGIGEVSGKRLSELIDFDSWTDMWLLREISSDHDLGTISQFAYVENWNDRSILKAGPAWDFDATFGNGMVPLFRNPRTLVTAMIDTKGIESTNQNRWLAPMYYNDQFREVLILKFKNEYYEKINQLLECEIDEYAEYIHRSALIDSLRWNSDGHWDYIYAPEGFEIVGEGDYHKYDVLAIHLDMVKEFLREKQRFLEELWIEGATFEVLVEEHYEDGMNLELNNNIYTWIRK